MFVFTGFACVLNTNVSSICINFWMCKASILVHMTYLVFPDGLVPLVPFVFFLEKNQSPSECLLGSEVERDLLLFTSWLFVLHRA